MRLAEALQTAWNALSDPDQEWLLSRQTKQDKPNPGEASVELLRYLKLDDSVTVVARSLRAKEAEKIQRALAELDTWLLNARS